MSLTQPASVSDPIVQSVLTFFQGLLEKYTPLDFNIRLWEGTSWGADPGEARFTLVIHHPGALRQMFMPANQLTLGESYIYDDFDIEGDIEAAFSLGDHIFSLDRRLLDKMRLGKLLLGLPSETNAHPASRAAHLRGAVHSKKRDALAVTYHYNVSNDFYRLWLDDRMVYSCAYFTSAEDSLGSAQEQKLDNICRKLRLGPGEKLLDIGCGWGGLIMHAARHYGVEALGITLSRPQAELANERIREAGLADRCRAEVCDYREVGREGDFDKLVSVGMVEHVGESRLEEYFSCAWNLLRPGGVFLNHGITSSLSHPDLPGPSFIDKYVFPDGELLPIATILRSAETVGFEIRDLESLREHYAMTLRHWVKRLEAKHEEAVRLTDEVTYRVWRLYMAGSAHGFKVGRLNLYQALLVKPDGHDSGMPLTRADWYV
jgi:cyclopropane-fatty-acyl-phospholipid synthase